MQNIIDAEAEVSPAYRKWLIVFRLLCLVFVAAFIGWLLNRISNSLEHTSQPAGFARGMLQGALMPMSMPNLLVGKDINIYSIHNTGVPYKLGYTMGVNLCGALFFGICFFRVSRWRRGKPMNEER